MRSYFLKLYIKGYIHIITGLIVVFISGHSFYVTWEAKSIIEKGKKVEVFVIETPINCQKVTSKTGFCKLQYQQKIFSKKTLGKKYCSYIYGKEKVVMLTNDKGDRILFPGEYNPAVFLFSFFMMGLSLWFFLKGVKINKDINE